jgi:protein gp37
MGKNIICNDSFLTVPFFSLPDLDLSGIDWVIVGGESGPGARPMLEEWVIDIRDQCITAGIPFFFKQWGGTKKKKAGRIQQGKTWNQSSLYSYIWLFLNKF